MTKRHHQPRMRVLGPEIRATSVVPHLSTVMVIPEVQTRRLARTGPVVTGPYVITHEKGECPLPRIADKRKENTAVTKNTKTIYLDEAGATGNHLLDPEQPFFVYASLGLEDDEASAIHAEMRDRFRIHGPELKGNSLAKRPQGREAILWLWDRVGTRSKIAVAEKMFALAGKFFEYMFEPVLARNNSLFYSIEFHKFIANFLYISHRSGDPDGRQVLEDFESLMRKHYPEVVEKVISPLDRLNTSDPMGAMLAFSLLNQDSIKDEIKLLRELDHGTRWDLELSQTMVHWLLAHWGEEFEGLEVYCDESKPIESNMSMFDHMIGRKDKAYIRLGGEPRPSLVYNLAEPVRLVDSRKYPGVQLADVLASSVAYSLKNREEEFSDCCLERTLGSFTLAIVAEPDEFQPDRDKGALNMLVLLEPLERSTKGEDLFEGMEEYILYQKLRMPEFREFQTIRR